MKLTHEVQRVPRSISLRVAIGGLVALAGWIAVTVIDHSGRPEYYYEHRHETSLAEYPTTAVVEWLGVVALALVGAIVYLVAARRTSPAVRLLALAVSFGGLLAFGLPFLMHTPPYFGAPFAFALLGGGWSVVMAVVAAIETRIRA